LVRSRKLDSDPLQLNRERNGFPGELVTIQNPIGAASEAYRMLRTNLFYALVDDPPKVIVLTSADPKEGKSTTVANLGVTLAEAGQSTLILDCDLRKPMLHYFFGVRNLSGMLDVLVGERKLQEVWQEPMPALKLVTPGPLPPNPAELLSSRRFAQFLAQVRQQFEYVLLDTPPIGSASDAAVLAANGDGVLLVLDSQRTSRSSLREALHTLESVGANVLGTVMNNCEVPRDGHPYIPTPGRGAN